jgi:hypothetical protein
MRGWGSRTQKATTLWSNSKAVGYFRTPSKFARGGSIKLTEVYTDARGNTKYKGNSLLKGSQRMSQLLS